MSSQVESKGLYVAIFAALMALTAVTVAAAYVNLGPWSPVVAVAIAGVKATLVVLYFMHVRHMPALTQLTVVAGVLWLVILLTLTFGDYASRAWQYRPGGW